MHSSQQQHPSSGATFYVVQYCQVAEQFLANGNNSTYTGTITTTKHMFLPHMQLQNNTPDLHSLVRKAVTVTVGQPQLAEQSMAEQQYALAYKWLINIIQDTQEQLANGNHL
jgi:hypothetical protein